MSEDEQKARAERFWFNIIAEAKFLTIVKMSKKFVPEDQVRQFCETMLQNALTKEEVK